MDEISRFVTGVANLVKEKCCMAMLHDEMNLSMLMVYTKSIEEPKLKRITRYLKRSGPSEQHHPIFKKIIQTQDEPRDPKVNFEKGSSSQNGKPIF